MSTRVAVDDVRAHGLYPRLAIWMAGRLSSCLAVCLASWQAKCLSTVADRSVLDSSRQLRLPTECERPTEDADGYTGGIAAADSVVWVALRSLRCPDGKVDVQ
jgi:hypothetical protein